MGACNVRWTWAMIERRNDLGDAAETGQCPTHDVPLLERKTHKYKNIALSYFQNKWQSTASLAR
jgi:hypothetical protein